MVYELLAEAESRPARGWDFAWLGDRLGTGPLPWSFEEIVVRHARKSPDLLDLGTGGGEWLSALPQRPPRTVATESWPANVAVAAARLGPLGIAVVAVEAAPDNVDQRPSEQRGRLPFPAESFALVSSRHESFLAEEVARVLAPSGTFVTQQVGSDWGDFYEALGLPRPRRLRSWDLRLATDQVEAAGLRVVDGGEAVEEIIFSDVGAFAWYLKAIPWTVECFSIAAQREPLELLHRRFESSGPLTFRLPAFWLEATRPSLKPFELSA